MRKVKLDYFPWVRVNIKNLWNYHLVMDISWHMCECRWYREQLPSFRGILFPMISCLLTVTRNTWSGMLQETVANHRKQSLYQPSRIYVTAGFWNRHCPQMGEFCVLDNCDGSSKKVTGYLVLMELAKFEYFINLDLPEIIRFPLLNLLNHHLGWNRSCEVAIIRPDGRIWPNQQEVGTLSHYFPGA